jgi:uncharacterized protein
MIATVVKAIFVDPWPFWVGGVLIGLLVPALYYYQNTALGVSTGYGNLVKMIIPPSRKLKWINKDYAETVSWRVFFIVGIIIGGFISALLSGSAGLTTQMGIFTAVLQWPFLANAFFFFVGGTLIGLGARIAGGCTSGHSIHGIANLHPSSIFATILFIIGGIITANLLRLALLGGAL